MNKLSHNRLAEGEATGHSHDAVAVDAQVWEHENGNRELRVPSGTNIIHQEHAEKTLAPGDFDISIQREFDPLEQAIRAVRD